MMGRLRSVAMSAMVIALAVVSAQAQARGQAGAAGACDRACLKTMLEQYLNAVIAHDPSKAALVIGFRQTENAINVRPGQGVWKTVTALGRMQRRFFDPVSGQAGYYGIVKEGDDEAIVTVRLRIENRKMTEAEWYIARANDPGLNGPRRAGGPPANSFNPDYLTANPPPERVVPVAQRLTRRELEAIVMSYFDAITSHDGSVALTHPGCGRVENGSPTPGGAFLPPLPRAGGAGPAQAPRAGGTGAAPGAPANPASNDCVANLQNFSAQMVVSRRIPLIDEESQTVLALALFVRRPGSPTPRNVFSEWFFIDQQRIRTIYTAMFYPAADLAVPNWPPYDGNWPLAAGTIPTPAAAPAGRGQ
jgi:hypothetical protein